ncbi:MAG: glycoside hydrolase family 3 C-terminal domain-containing protein, partial [Proteiniphilum sp.]|nr:glycoside hydrolase family 3 C-terminal domain-containing protein [Proteiniphilum sp.]
MKTNLLFSLSLLLIAGPALPREKAPVSSVTATVNEQTVSFIADSDPSTRWHVDRNSSLTGQSVSFVLRSPGDIHAVEIGSDDLSKKDIERLLDIFVTYDPMNPGDPVRYTVSGGRPFRLTFEPKYGAHVILALKGNVVSKAYSIHEIALYAADRDSGETDTAALTPWMNANLPVDERVEMLLAAMTPDEKMELIREGWGIPGVPRLHIPPIAKVEAIHGFSYGRGATIYPQSIGMGAAFDRTLTEEVAKAIGVEMKSAGTFAAWSPVLDVAQDPRWGRCEETYGEDPVLVSQIGGAWIKGLQSQGLWTTPKHFGVHGAPLGGRDSHDIGLSEREAREIHLVPFRHVIREYDCQSLMMSYNDYMGVPVAKSKELLHHILREEWGFSGFIVSDCGALGNMTARKHYTAEDFVEAAELALAAGIATNCGNTYNNKEVIAAAKEGKLNRENLDNVCRSMLRPIIRAGLLENSPSEPLDWNKQYPAWNSSAHRAIARKAAQKSIVLLKNREQTLPLSKSIRSIAVIGPGSDQPMTGDYTFKNPGEQVVSVLKGIREAADPATKVIHERGCEFFKTDYLNLDASVKAAKESDAVIIILGDCSTSDSAPNIVNTSGENHDYATLDLPGYQQQLLEAVCQTGKPVILVLQAGRPFNLSYAAENCAAILVNWLPGQEGGHATADVLFGDCNPAGRLPMTFPRHVGQVPLYYNFKTSGRRYNYVDMDFTPLYPFGYGLSYTTFAYSGLKTEEQENGNVKVQVDVKNTGTADGEEVVQLYVTDMYATVKTRVMELKNFDRVFLPAGETKTVTFTLTPYELSLLNDSMDRVVEPGEYKIMVGGRSPSCKAGDRIKDSIGYPESSDGVSGKINYTRSFKADFVFAYRGMTESLLYGNRKIAVEVTNTGNLNDAGKISMYVNGVKQDDTHHYELDPGESKTVFFDLSNETGIKDIV